jgi:hypothetical protein
MLRRESGPLGWTDLPTGRYEVDGWEVFEGDPDSPHMCRGWFRCTAKDFRASKRTALSLQLFREDGSDHHLEVEIVHVKTTAPEWEFVAARSIGS